MYDIFLCGIGDSHDFIVVLLCNMNPFGLTLTLLRKRPGRFLRIPLSPPVRIQVEPLNLYSFFYALGGIKVSRCNKKAR